MAFDKNQRRQTIKFRIRKKISGTDNKPRLSVFRSNRHIFVQLVNDIDRVTILSVSSKDKKIESENVSKIGKAKLVGTLLAESAKNAGIENVVFDRNGYLYHGRVKALGDAAREGGLKF